MKIFQNKYFATALLLTSPGLVIAQTKPQQPVVRKGTDSTFKTQSLDIYSTYKPEIAPAPKPTFVPNLPVIDTAKPVLSYVVPDQTIAYSYKAEPIKPLALKRDREALPFANYAKLGIGSKNTFLIDAGIGSFVGNNYDAIFHFNHLSQKGNQFQNQKWSQNTLDAASNFYLKKYTLNLGMQADRRVYRQYGYNTDFYSYAEKDLRNTYYGGIFNAVLTPLEATSWGLKFKPELSIYNWNNNAKTNAYENSINLKLPVSKTINENFTAGIELGASVTSYVSNKIGFSNNYFSANPFVEVNYENVKARVGIKPIWASQKNYVLPDVSLNAWVMDKKIKLFAAWEGQFNQNAYRSLSLTNPYMESFYSPTQGRLSHVYAGFETAIKNHIIFGGSIGYKMWNNLAMYQNNYMDSTDGRKFKMVYEDINALTINGKFQYLVSDKFNINGSTEWNFYAAKKPGVRAEHLPSMTLNGGFMWQPVKNLWIGADVVVYNGIYAKKTNGLYSKLPAIVDLNFKASYDISKRVGVFVEFNNILNSRYQYWNQYNNIGFNVVGGVRFKF